MHKKLLLVLFCILCGVYIWFRSPVGSDYYMNKGLADYNAKNYSQAVDSFEKSLASNSVNARSELYLVKSLSKLKPSYTVQKKLYKISKSSVNPASKELAKYAVSQIKKELLSNFSDNYIYNAMQGKEIIRWDIKSFPLKVYFENIDEVPAYYKENIFKAMEQWYKRTGFIKYEQTKDKNIAQIYVVFRDINTFECPPNKECKYTIAYTEPVIDTNNVLKKYNFTFYKTNPKGDHYTRMQVYNTALHELGHTLGIMGHSDNPNDVMYENNDRASDIYSAYRSDSQYLSMRDLRTVALLYSLAPSISDVKNLSPESFFYPPLVLGEDEEIFIKKIHELEKYIKKYPHFASGYINIASVYAEMGDKEKGLSNLKKAESLASSDDEKYMTYYNRSVIYFNSQDYDLAKEAALKAQGVKNTPEIQSIISEINELLK